MPGRCEACSTSQVRRTHSRSACKQLPRQTCSLWLQRCAAELHPDSPRCSLQKRGRQLLLRCSAHRHARLSLGSLHMPKQGHKPRAHPLLRAPSCRTALSLMRLT